MPVDSQVHPLQDALEDLPDERQGEAPSPIVESETLVYAAVDSYMIRDRLAAQSVRLARPPCLIHSPSLLMSHVGVLAPAHIWPSFLMSLLCPRSQAEDVRPLERSGPCIGVAARGPEARRGRINGPLPAAPRAWPAACVELASASASRRLLHCAVRPRGFWSPAMALHERRAAPWTRVARRWVCVCKIYYNYTVSGDFRFSRAPPRHSIYVCGCMIGARFMIPYDKG